MVLAERFLSIFLSAMAIVVCAIPGGMLASLVVLVNKLPAWIAIALSIAVAVGWCCLIGVAAQHVGLWREAT